MFNDLDFQIEALDTSAIGAVEFEKLTFHLLDEMGFQELAWRKGGEGNSATDGGRDLEAQYWAVGPTTANTERYWFEVKFRTGQLEKSQVQNAALNAVSRADCDHLVVVTNTTVSNPCLDWIKDFQAKHRTPSVKVWQGHDLELILRKTPRTLARFLPSALNLRGRCKVIESKFSNLFILPSPQELEELWDIIDSPDLTHATLQSAVFAEVSFGDILARRWGMRVNIEKLNKLLALSIVNIYALALRCTTNQRSQEPLIDGIAYLIMCSLIRSGAPPTARIIADPGPVIGVDNESLSDQDAAERWTPPLRQIYRVLAQRCSAMYCMKLSYDPAGDENRNFFEQFMAEPKPHKHDGIFLVMQSKTDECKIGLVDTESFCPLGDNGDGDDVIGSDDLESYLRFAENVLRARIDEIEKEE